MFNKLFDFNGDGKLDAGEKALEFMTFMSIMDDSDDEATNPDENENYMEDE